MMKRLFDIILSFIATILLLPFFLLIALAIKLTSPGPIFFKQQRIGYHFDPFYIYKFRTMHQNAASQGGAVTLKSDPRITPAGHFLRKYKLDELPQLFNILKGEMSFVGPRPEVKKYVDLNPEDFRIILSVRPGLTDPASLLFRNEADLIPNNQNWEEYYTSVILKKKMELSKEYVQKASLSLDIKLIWQTLSTLILKPSSP